MIMIVRTFHTCAVFIWITRFGVLGKIRYKNKSWAFVINRFQNVSTGIEKWHDESSTRFCVKLQLFSVSFMTNVWDAKMASRVPCAALTYACIYIMALARFLILRGNGPFFAISSWRIKFSFLDVLDCQDFEDKTLVFLPKFVILKKISLLEWMRFWREFLFLFSNEWDFANRFSFYSRDSKFWVKKKTLSPFDSSTWVKYCKTAHFF